MADKMYAEQKDTRAAKGCVPMVRPGREDVARNMWDIVISEGDARFHTTRKNKHALKQYKQKAAFLMTGEKMSEKKSDGATSKRSCNV